ncbi:hypothetical protein ACFLZ8_00870 [Planctomycetota bacterium]
MEKKYINSNMKLGYLRKILTEISKEIGYNFEIWLSCDEEGNEFLPMSSNEELCIGVDTENMRVIFFPSHR